MIVHECRQGSDEWHRWRLGKPTASQLHRILTPKKLEVSKPGAFSYLAECVAEFVNGGPIESASTLYMERGHDQEAEAIAAYEFERNVDVRVVGFITNDAGTIGCSPDGLVGEDGGLEIKLLKLDNHVKALLRPQAFADSHRMQVQGALLVTGRKWWDVMAHNPVLPSVIVRVERDEEVIGKLEPAAETFAVELNETLVRFGFKKPETGDKDGNEGNEGVRRVRDDEGSRDISALIATS